MGGRSVLGVGVDWGVFWDEGEGALLETKGGLGKLRWFSIKS